MLSLSEGEMQSIISRAVENAVANAVALLSDFHPQRGHERWSDPKKLFITDDGFKITVKIEVSRG
jgi:hypothetical protein